MHMYLNFIIVMFFSWIGMRVDAPFSYKQYLQIQNCRVVSTLFGVFICKWAKTRGLYAEWSRETHYGIYI